MPYRLVDPSTSPRLRTTLHVIAGVASALFILGGIVLVSQIYTLAEATRQTQIANTARQAIDRQRDEQTAETAADAARAAARIEDCTTPGRKCFEDGQRRLRGTVASINDYALAAAFCADRPDAQSVVELEVCIRARIEDERQG